MHSIGSPVHQALHTPSIRNRKRFLLSNAPPQHDGCTSSHVGIRVALLAESVLPLREVPFLQAPFREGLLLVEVFPSPLFSEASFQEVLFPMAV